MWWGATTRTHTHLHTQMPSHHTMHLPEIFLVGPPHAGSTALWESIMKHPDTLPVRPRGALHTVKEPGVFQYDWRWRNGSGLAAYRKRCAHPTGKVVVDGSVMSGTEKAPARMLGAYNRDGGFAPSQRLPTSLVLGFVVCDPMRTLSSGVRHDCGCEKDSDVPCRGHCGPLGDAAAARVLVNETATRCVVAYSRCAAERERVGYPESRIWESCRVDSARDCAPRQDSSSPTDLPGIRIRTVLARSALNALNADKISMWASWAAPQTMVLVRNEDIPGFGAARAIWAAARLHDVRGVDLRPLNHSFMHRTKSSRGFFGNTEPSRKFLGLLAEAFSNDSTLVAAFRSESRRMCRVALTAPVTLTPSLEDACRQN